MSSVPGQSGTHIPHPPGLKARRLLPIMRLAVPAAGNLRFCAGLIDSEIRKCAAAAELELAKPNLLQSLTFSGDFCGEIGKLERFFCQKARFLELFMPKFNLY